MKKNFWGPDFKSELAFKKVLFGSLTLLLFFTLVGVDDQPELSKTTIRTLRTWREIEFW